MRKIYKTNTYNEIVNKEVTKFYKTNKKQKFKYIKKLKTRAIKFKLDNRIKCLTKVEPFIKLKGHIDNFTNKPTWRLLNFTESNSGKVSKYILENMFKDVYQI